MNLDKSKKPSKSILAKKKGKGYQQYGILLFTMLKTLDSFLYWNPILTKTQPWSRNLRTVMRTVSNIQEEKGVCHNQEVQCEQAILHSDSTLHCKGERSLEASCLCQLYFERIQRTCPSLGRFYVC